MKKLLIAISMVLALGGLAQAGSSRGASYQGYSSGVITILGSPVVVDTRGGLIYNMTVMANSAGNATLSIYDTSTGGSIPASETPIYQVEVSSANDSRTVDLNAAPIQTYSGIVATVTNGIAYLNVEK